MSLFMLLGLDLVEVVSFSRLKAAAKAAAAASEKEKKNWPEEHNNNK